MKKIAILGTGFGFEHAKIFSKFSDVEIIGIYGRNHSKLQEIHEELQIPIFEEIESLINHPDIDLIDVVLPTKLHKEYVIRALKAGKHVFCETPLAFTLEDAEEMYNVAKEMNKEIFVGLFMLFSPEFRYVLDQLPSPTIGDIHSVFLSRRTPRIWGNMDPMVLNLMIHDFDYIYALKGLPIAISAYQIQVPQVKGEQIFVKLYYDDCIAIIDGLSLLPKSYPFSLTLRVNGTHETIEIHYPVNNDYDKCQVSHFPAVGEKVMPEIVYGNEYKLECRYVVDYISGKKLPRRNQIEIAIESIKMALIAQKSFKNNGEKIIL